jgi:hypothetical protein
MMYVAMLQITKDVTQLIDYSQVSPVVIVGGGGGTLHVTWESQHCESQFWPFLVVAHSTVLLFWPFVTGSIELGGVHVAACVLPPL